jgi:hypothetical protein
VDATVTLKVTPGEFDLLRVALESRRDAMLRRGDDRDVDPQSRRAAKAEALQLTDILGRLR